MPLLSQFIEGAQYLENHQEKETALSLIELKFGSPKL